MPTGRSTPVAVQGKTQVWLTARELANELHIAPKTLTSLRRHGKVAYVNLGSVKYPRFRYQMPARTPAQLQPAPIERVGILTYAEVGAILGTNVLAVRKMVQRKDLAFVNTVGNRRMITIEELRRVLVKRDKRTGQEKRSYSPILVKWLRKYLVSGIVSHETLDALIREAAAVTSDRRSGYITRLWDLFDQVNAVLKAIEEERKGLLGEAQRTPPAPQ